MSRSALGVGTVVPALSETPEQFRSVIELHLSACTALAFLASDAGGYITGITLPVEGGLLTT